MASIPYPNQTLILCELISVGCPNLNYKIQLENQNQPLILCIYLPDKDDADREQKFAALIEETVLYP
ncbi:MAG: hypothetical protein ACK5PQ_04030 [Alphaproteobacteria bacterium]